MYGAKHEASERILDTLETADVLLRDSTLDCVAVFQYNAYQRTRNDASGVLVEERTYMT